MGCLWERVVTMHALSSHADADDLMRWVRSVPVRPRPVFVTHGEPSSPQALATTIVNELAIVVRVFALNGVFKLHTERGAARLIMTGQVRLGAL